MFFVIVLCRTLYFSVLLQNPISIFFPFPLFATAAATIIIVYSSSSDRLYEYRYDELTFVVELADSSPAAAAASFSCVWLLLAHNTI